MQLSEIKTKIPEQFYNILDKEFKELRPSQSKAIEAGLLDNKSLLICTPTASGKTLIAELAMIKSILANNGKAVYIVPLKALATEKYKEFKRKYDGLIKVALSIGDSDSNSYLESSDLIITTSEKLDSLIRHTASWIINISVIVVDEIHLLNDPSRGPTLEIVLTILKKLVKNAQLLGLSATIGNPKELADWLNATLVEDTWRPVKLHKGIYHEGEIDFSD